MYRECACIGDCVCTGNVFVLEIVCTGNVFVLEIVCVQGMCLYWRMVCTENVFVPITLVPLQASNVLLAGKYLCMNIIIKTGSYRHYTEEVGHVLRRNVHVVHAQRNRKIYGNLERKVAIPS